MISIKTWFILSVEQWLHCHWFILRIEQWLHCHLFRSSVEQWPNCHWFKVSVEQWLHCHQFRFKCWVMASLPLIQSKCWTMAPLPLIQIEVFEQWPNCHWLKVSVEQWLSNPIQSNPIQWGTRRGITGMNVCWIDSFFSPLMPWLFKGWTTFLFCICKYK